ncbi:MAG: CAP domain-containing protein [Bacteroidales bacterium]|nr:MAG: CAP domain-containing protein [Bacteroidales bacterium]
MKQLFLVFFLSSFYISFSQTNENELFTMLEGQILKIINEYRKSIGLEELVFNKDVFNEAKKHSTNMAEGKTPFSHDGFDNRFERLMKVVGGSSMAENVALGQTTAQEVVDNWLSSQGHKQNIEGNFNMTGIGIASGSDGELYFTQIFLLK